MKQPVNNLKSNKVAEKRNLVLNDSRAPGFMVGGGSQRLHGEFWGKGWQKPFSRSHALRARPASRITNDKDAEFKLHPAESFVNKKACVGFPRFLEPVFLKKGKNVDITLSNVASSFAIANGGAPLFFENPEVSMKVK
ncbi:MAG: hypothetical protein II595_08230 [Desulfovibrio sp.]|nr:hypothetical protein [Desulfovibrio sp.]